MDIGLITEIFWSRHLWAIAGICISKTHYIYLERERERERELFINNNKTLNIPTHTLEY
jgi:hypothetical protein